MSTEIESELRARVERLDALIGRVQAVQQQFELAAQVALKSVSGPAFLAAVREVVFDAAIAEQSPFVSRQHAAIRWFCDDSEIDKAVRMGILTKHKRGTGTLFEKAEGDEAIRTGKWVRFEVKTAEKLERQRRAA